MVWFEPMLCPWLSILAAAGVPMEPDVARLLGLQCFSWGAGRWRWTSPQTSTVKQVPLTNHWLKCLNTSQHQDEFQLATPGIPLASYCWLIIHRQTKVFAFALLYDDIDSCGGGCISMAAGPTFSCLLCESDGGGSAWLVVDEEGWSPTTNNNQWFMIKTWPMGIGGSEEIGGTTSWLLVSSESPLLGYVDPQLVGGHNSHGF